MRSAPGATSAPTCAVLPLQLDLTTDDWLERWPRFPEEPDELAALALALGVSFKPGELRATFKLRVRLVYRLRSGRPL